MVEFVFADDVDFVAEIGPFAPAELAPVVLTFLLVFVTFDALDKVPNDDAVPVPMVKNKAIALIIAICRDRRFLNLRKLSPLARCISFMALTILFMFICSLHICF